MKGIDMTTGSILKKVVRVAVPVLVTNLINMAYNLTDMFWLGQVSQSALSAVGAMGLFMWLGISIAAICKIGTEVKISQLYGKHDFKGVNSYATNGILLMTIVASLYAVAIFLFKDNIIAVYNFESQEIVDMAYNYLKFIPASMFFGMIVHEYISIYNGIGNTKLVFKIVGLGLIINIILDPILILKFDLGTTGAAIATFIAMFSGLVMFTAYSKFRSDVVRNFTANIDFKKIFELVNLGVIPMFQQVFFTVIFIIMSVYIVKFGDENIAVSRIGGQVESLTWIIGAAATTAVTVFTGQNYGVKNYNRISNGFTMIMLMMVSYSILVTLLFVFKGKELFLFFLPNEQNTAVLGASYLLINAFAQPFMMMESVVIGFFNGQGKTKIPAFTSIFANGTRIPLMIYLANIYGVNGVWYSMAITSAMRGIILIIAMMMSVAKDKDFKFKYFILNKEVYNA